MLLLHILELPLQKTLIAISAVGLLFPYLGSQPLILILDLIYADLL